MKVIVVDPKITPTTEKMCDLHLRPYPGTDGALALCMGSILIRKGWIDKEYIDKYVHGFKEYAEYEIHKENHPKISLKDKSKSEELKKLEKANKEKHIEEMKHLEKRAESLFDYLNLKYRLGEKEIEALSLYFGLDGHKRKNFSEIQNIMKIDNDSLDKIVKDALFKLSVVDEKVEL